MRLRPFLIVVFGVRFRGRWVISFRWWSASVSGCRSRRSIGRCLGGPRHGSCRCAVTGVRVQGSRRRTLQAHCLVLSTAPDSDGGQRTVPVTHPFHPWLGREFVFVAVRRMWGEERVFFLDADGVERSLPTGWTDAGKPDVMQPSPVSYGQAGHQIRHCGSEAYLTGDSAQAVGRALPAGNAAHPPHQ